VHLLAPGDVVGMYGDPLDSVALNVVAPFVAACRRKGWIQQYFFIRYGEGGPHLRFRLKSTPEQLERVVLPALQRHLEKQRSLLLPASTHGMSGLQEALPPLPVKWVAYEPETDRYGGVHALPVSERLFCVSSDFALATLKDLKAADRSTRLGKALLAMLASIHAFSPERADAIRFCDQYHRGYLHVIASKDADVRERVRAGIQGGVSRQLETIKPYVVEAWRRLSNHESLSPPIDRLVKGMRDGASAVADFGRSGLLRAPIGMPDARVAILSSNVHMTSNRLGVSIDEESFLASACVAALQGPLNSD
jgi:thiopeptide-type bacteriocin biosynthesis protein